MNKLIILGNGFDLQAGLKSSFADFFVNKEIPKIEAWIDRTNAINGINKLSFISLLLYNTYYRKPIYRQRDLQPIKTDYNEEYQRKLKISNDKNDWMNIESFLKSLLTKKIYDYMNRYYYELLEGKNTSDFICYGDYVRPFILKTVYLQRNINIKLFSDYLHNELELFENEFAEYLKEQLIKNDRYDNYSKTIGKSLIEGYSDGKIINFNYTSIGNYSNFTECNVHGKIDNSPIIGIDSTDLDNDDAIGFSKTYRKLIRNDSPGLLVGKIDEITIYGHSLGNQDYAYFQSIFDYVDLYNNNTIVRLIYSDNFYSDELDKKVHRNNVAKKLFKLINTYGGTLNNKDNGKNLLHKLILEGRIKLELRNFINEW